MQLREYQKIVLNKLYKSAKTNKKILVSLPTGAGKTIMMYKWAQLMAQRGKRTIIVVDREELIDQTFALDPSISILKAQREHDFNADALIQLVMLQTGYRRLNLLLDIQADYIFFDEIHNYYEGMMIHALIDSMPQAILIGVTATPIDNKGYLLSGFDDYIGDIQTATLIDEGFLVEPQYYVPEDYHLKLNSVRISSGDYNVEDLERLQMTTEDAELMYREWYERAFDRQTIVFCSSVKHAQFLANTFKNHGVEAAAIWSADLARTHLVEQYKKRQIKVLCNVGILVAGFDDPQTSCIIFANPTRVLRKYLQQAGRGLRICEKKRDCLMLDFANVTQQHGFCSDLRFFFPKKQETEVLYKDCPECGAILPNSAQKCPYCGYEFQDDCTHMLTSSVKRRHAQQLEKAFSLQKTLKEEIGRLVDERGYRPGYKWFLFLDCLKTKKPSESSVQFFKRKITKIRLIEKKQYKLASLKYN